jgi:hypothetical protein
MPAGVRQLDGIVLAILFFQEGNVRKMKSIHLLLSAVLLTLAAVWARAAAQGLEQALVSTGVECCVKGLRARTRAFSNINSFWPARIFTRAPEYRIFV